MAKSIKENQNVSTSKRTYKPRQKKNQPADEQNSETPASKREQFLESADNKPLIDNVTDNKDNTKIINENQLKPITSVEQIPSGDAVNKKKSGRKRKSDHVINVSIQNPDTALDKVEESVNFDIKNSSSKNVDANDKDKNVHVKSNRGRKKSVKTTDKNDWQLKNKKSPEEKIKSYENQVEQSVNSNSFKEVLNPKPQEEKVVVENHINENKSFKKIPSETNPSVELITKNVPSETVADVVEARSKERSEKIIDQAGTKVTEQKVSVEYVSEKNDPVTPELASDVNVENKPSEAGVTDESSQNEVIKPLKKSYWEQRRENRKKQKLEQKLRMQNELAAAIAPVAPETSEVVPPAEPKAIVNPEQKLREAVKDQKNPKQIPNPKREFPNDRAQKFERSSENKPVKQNKPQPQAKKYLTDQPEALPEKIVETKRDFERKDLKSEDMQYEQEVRDNKERKIRENKADLERKENERKAYDVIKNRVMDYKSKLNKSLLPTLSHRSNPIFIKFLNEVEKFLKRVVFVETGYKIIAAVSGGVDSTVMLDALFILSEKMGFELYAAHFNHNLRGERSNQDAKYVEQSALNYGLQYFVSEGNVRQYSEKNDMSIETAARTLRYNFYERTSRTIEADYVATAHNADDSAETFLLNLIRGTGLTGLAGIPPVRPLVKNVQMIRPLMVFSKDEIKKYAEIRDLKWSEDETNAVLEFTRNKIRLDLIPKLKREYNPQIVESIIRTSRLIEGADDLISDIVRRNLQSLVAEGGNERFIIKINILQTFTLFMQGELIQAALQKYFKQMPASMKTIDRVIDLLDSEPGAICEITGQIYALRDRNTILFTRKSPIENVNAVINAPGEFRFGKYRVTVTEILKKPGEYEKSKYVEYIDADEAGKIFELRNWKPGDAFKPLGTDGRMKISDFLINEKVNLIDKNKILVLTNNYDIVWVIGMRLDDRFKITSKTKRIWKLESIKKEDYEKNNG